MHTKEWHFNFFLLYGRIYNILKIQYLKNIYKKYTACYQLLLRLWGKTYIPYEIHQKYKYYNAEWNVCKVLEALSKCHQWGELYIQYLQKNLINKIG